MAIPQIFDELADGLHHVIPCPVPGHQGERSSPGLDIRYAPPATGRLPVGRQWLLRCWGAQCKYVSIAQSLGIDPEEDAAGKFASQLVAAYDHKDGHSRRVYHAWWPEDFPADPASCPRKDCGRPRNDRHRHVNVRGSQSGTQASLWGPPAATGVLVVVGSEDEAVALLRGGVRRAGFIPVTWYRAGREPGSDRDSVESTDWSPVKDHHVAFWPRESGDAKDEMLRAAHQAVDAGAASVSVLQPSHLEEFSGPEIFDVLNVGDSVPTVRPRQAEEESPSLQDVIAPMALNATDASLSMRFLRDHGNRIVEAGYGPTSPWHSPPASLYIRTESGGLLRDDELFGSLLWKSAQGYREELAELMRAGELSNTDLEVSLAHLARMESGEGLRALCEQAGTASRFMRERGVLPEGYTHAMARDIDANTRYLGAPNCIIDLETGDTFTGRSAGDTLVSLTISDPYDAEATHPDLDFLVEHLEEDGLGELLPALGYALSCRPRDLNYLTLVSTTSCCIALIDAVCNALGSDYATRVPADVLFHPERWASFAPQLSGACRARILGCTSVYPYGQTPYTNPSHEFGQNRDFNSQRGRPPSFIALEVSDFVEVVKEGNVSLTKMRALGQTSSCAIGGEISTRLTHDARARQALMALLVRYRVAQVEPPEGIPVESIEWTAKWPEEDSAAFMIPATQHTPSRIDDQAHGPMQELDRWLQSAIVVTGHPGDRLSSASLWQAARDTPSSDPDSSRVWGMSRRSFTTRAMQLHGLDSPGSVRIDGSVTTGWTGARLSDDLLNSGHQPGN